jgi:folate-dependent phosphoribosylglycinamide formyltransferase PurN
VSLSNNSLYSLLLSLAPSHPLLPIFFPSSVFRPSLPSFSSSPTDAIEAKKINAKITIVVSNRSNAYILERAKAHALPCAYIPSKKGNPDENQVGRWRGGRKGRLREKESSNLFQGESREEWDQQVIKMIEATGNVDVVMLIGYDSLLFSTFSVHFQYIFSTFSVHFQYIPPYPSHLKRFMRILSPLFVSHFKNKLINVHPSLLPEFAGGMDVNVHEEVLKAGKDETGCTVCGGKRKTREEISRKIPKKLNFARDEF